MQLKVLSDTGRPTRQVVSHDPFVDVENIYFVIIMHWYITEELLSIFRLPEPARPEMGHGIACLPRPQEKLAPHSTCVILGWGKKRPTDIHGTRILHEAQVSFTTLHKYSFLKYSQKCLHYFQIKNKQNL